MKRITFALTVLFVAGIAIYSAVAQPPGGGRGPGGGQGPGGRGLGGPDGFRPPTHPLEEALDADGDHQISAKEIENAIAALKKLDKNSDGKLGEDELRPQFGGRRGGGEGGGRGFGSREGRGRGDGGRGGRGPEGERSPRDSDAARGASVDDMLARVLSFDKNDDGKLTKDEIPERMQGMLTRGDANDDGALDRDELAKIAARFQGGGEGGRPRGDRAAGRRPDVGVEGRGGPGGPPSPETIVDHAMRFDADGDEKLSRDELTKFAHEMARRRGGQGGPDGRGGPGGRGREGGDRAGGRPQRPTGE